MQIARADTFLPAAAAIILKSRDRRAVARLERRSPLRTGDGVADQMGKLSSWSDAALATLAAASGLQGNGTGPCATGAVQPIE